MAVAEVVVVAVGAPFVGVAGTNPSDRWDKTAVSGTRIANSWCGRCDCTAVSYILSPCPLDRLCIHCLPTLAPQSKHQDI